jgi:peptide/nickel transport system substrate-binding protein
VCNPRVKTPDGPVTLMTPNYMWNIERWYVEVEG